MAGVILCWGLGPPISKLITAPAVISVLYRFWLSTPLLFALAVLVGSPPRWSVLRRTFIPGAAFGVNLVFVFLALNEAAVAVLSVVTTLQPGVILLIAGLFLGERPRFWHVAWTMVGIGGTAVVVLGAGADFDVSPLGVLYAVCALVTFTLYFVLTRQARSLDPDLGALEWMAGISLAAAVTVTPWALAVSSGDDYRALAGIDWLWLAFIIGVTGIAGHVMMAWTHRYIEATRSSLYLLSMNIVAIGAAWFIHDEPLGWIQILGGVVVFTAVAAVISRPPHRVAPWGRVPPSAGGVARVAPPTAQVPGPDEGAEPEGAPAG
ncbi:MAG: DMT family transporter [Actinomycetota bacterium]